MRLFGDYAFIYFRIVDYFNYCTLDPYVYGIDKKTIENFQREMHVELTEGMTNDEKITEFLENILIAIDDYRTYMLKNAVQISIQNKINNLNISKDQNSIKLLAVLENLSNFSVNVCYVLFELSKRGKSLRDYVVANSNIIQEQILDQKDFIKLKDEVLSVLFDIYEV